VGQTITAAERLDIVWHDWTKNAPGAPQVAEKREKRSAAALGSQLSLALVAERAVITQRLALLPVLVER
jgi:hypothetical protein